MRESKIMSNAKFIFKDTKLDNEIIIDIMEATGNYKFIEEKLKDRLLFENGIFIVQLWKPVKIKEIIELLEARASQKARKELKQEIKELLGIKD